MKNLKVGKKLLLSFGVILTLFVISLVVAIVGIQQNAQALDDFYEQPFNIVDTTWEMREATVAIQKNIFWIVTSNDLAVVNQCKADIDTNITIVDDGIAVLKAKFLGDKQLLDEYIRITDEAILEQNEIVNLSLMLTDEANQQALDMMEKTYLPKMDKATEKLISISEFAHNNAVIYNNNGTQIKVVSTVLLLILGIASLLISILLGVQVTKGITRPLSEVEKAAREFSKGNLKNTITYQSHDEVGSLADAMRDTSNALSTIIDDIHYLLNEMANGNFNVHTSAEQSYVGEFYGILQSMRHINSSLSDTLSQINTASEQVAAGSDQVSSGAQELSQGATEQASAVEELAATITEISDQVNRNAQHAHEASQKSRETAQELENGKKRMEEMVSTIQEINTSSAKISEIIATIENIAFQTNILALNAAVEAARAGTAGKGFAVVADEVRNLANKSQEASKNTSALIESTLQSVASGTQKAEETAQSLNRIVLSSESAAALVHEISKASQDQAQSIVQVTQGIDQVSSVVQTNSATAQESAAASEELSGQAQMLKSLVGRFQLKNAAVNTFSTMPEQQIDESAQFFSESKY